MIIDGSSIGGLPDANKVQNVDNTNRTSDPTKESGLGKAGQTTDAGPAVVTSFSAASLESARAVSDTTQVADQNRPEEQQNKPVQMAQSSAQQERVDVMA
jgi:hypothetical protein